MQYLEGAHYWSDNPIKVPSLLKLPDNFREYELPSQQQTGKSAIRLVPVQQSSQRLLCINDVGQFGRVACLATEPKGRLQYVEF